MLKPFKIAGLSIAIFIMVSFFGGEVNATHLRAGQLIVERVNCQGLTFRISFVIYKDTGSTIEVGGGTLRFGDGSDPDNDGEKGYVVPTESSNDPSMSTTNLGNELAVVRYSITHTYGAPGRYVISYFEMNRNFGILNIQDSGNTSFYIEAEINIDPFFGCDNSPIMLIPPVDEACTGVAFVHNPGAYDPDGDSLSFELVVPKMDRGADVVNYRSPIAPEFYVNFDYLNEDKTDEPSFSINPYTGELYWDAPGDKLNEYGGREYNVAFKVTEWRKIQGRWYRLGYVIRDMQIIVRECDNDRPDLIVPDDICVEAGTLIDESIIGIDPNNDDVKIEAFSQVFFLNSNSATIDPSDGRWQPINSASVNFLWQTDCFHVRDQPYQVVFKITDDPVDGPKLVNFATWNITVIAPKPEWVNAQADFAKKEATLEWEQYDCFNAQAIQIWRRVDSYNYVPGECETGMPDFLGYELIDQVSPLETTYIDNNKGNGLNVAAGYCYRLVAVFGQPSGGESIISSEICLDPMIADAPVMTHVTVDKTDKVAGEVTVSWKPPFDIDKVKFGTDYRYEVQQGLGLISNTFKNVGTTADTTFTVTALNTEDNAHVFRVVLYSNDATVVGPTDPIDTSAVASTVWLQPKPLYEKINLFWTFNVPWTNNVQNYPWHYIYRGEESDGEMNLTLIDSVNVNLMGYNYLDSGQWNSTPLLNTDLYCYYVETQGSYGNPKVESPQINKSQMICVQPNDDVAPCQPELEVATINCEDFLENSGCGFTDFENIIKWKATVPGGCQDDVQFYELYYANSTKAEFQYLATVTDTIYIDTDLTSFARCYKVRAVDRSGNRSEFSEKVCFDNCPYYELPNVFTPGNNDGCNDLFSAYSDREIIDENGNSICGERDLTRCARFVQSVEFRVYNRWGRQVFDYKSGGEKTIYIDWDGRDSNGNELSSGTYFYIAEVVFDLVDPSKRRQEMKGWVQIIR